MVGDLKADKAYTINNEDDEAIVSVVPPTVEVESEEGEGAEASDEDAQGEENTEGEEKAE